MMKRIAYSPICKLIAFMLCIASICTAVWTLFSINPYMIGGQKYIESYPAAEYCRNAARMVLNELEATVEGSVRAKYIREELARDYQVEYYASYGTTEVTNSVNHQQEYYECKQIYMTILYRDDDENEAFFAPGIGAYIPASVLDCYTLYLCVNDDYIAARQSEWDMMKPKFDSAVNTMLLCLGVILLCFFYLAWVTGRTDKDDEIHLILIDRVYTEFRLAVMLGIGILYVVLAAVAMDEFEFNAEPLIVKLLSFGSGAAGAVILAFALSLIRSLKNRVFLERSLIWRFFKLIKRIWLWLWRGVKRVLLWLWNGMKYVCEGVKRNIIRIFAKDFSGRKLVLLILAYTGVLCFSILLTALIPPFGILLFLAVIIGACVFAVKRVDGFIKIKDGLHTIRMGKLDEKITDCPDGVLSDIAEDINEISEGLSKAVDKQVRAERMKSELITNVSHDLKTPLTSIINYADLLTQRVLSPEEANDYAAIIKQKSERLKKLTADLFDVSKSQSGNDVIHSERLDAALLVKQSLAEQNDAIMSSSLDFVTSYPEQDVFIMADGKKLSRVFENLIGNILKYSLEHTRVYIQMHVKNNEVIMEFKNIANYPMNFDDDEITERFVRGDLSRSTEGSGLGLAIARSYVQACGGTMRIITDGDLFKAVITFPMIE